MKSKSLIRPPELQKGSQNGFALIEALVAILIFSLGILSSIGLQASMTREQTSAKLRSDAAFLASGLIGTIWGDAGSSGSAAKINNYATANCASYAPCAEWQKKLAANLPGGASTVVVNSITTDVTITITWTMPNGDVHQYVIATTIVAA